MTGHGGPPGRHMAEEIAAQPGVLAGLLRRQAEIAAVARHVRDYRPRFVLVAGRGSSEHAARYAQYLANVLLGLPAGLVDPATTTLYGAEPAGEGVLLLAVSQSGAAPDLLAVTETARRRGALTVAVTNTPGSPLPDAAELCVELGAGQESAVAATKTYTASLLALYLLLDAVRGGRGERAAGLGEAAHRTLDDVTSAVADAVRRYRFARDLVATGRGYSAVTASEAALKLAETSYLHARAYSGASLLHGPVAAVDAGTAVLAVVSAGRGGAAMGAVLDAVRGRGADVLAIGSAATEVPAQLRIPVPETAEELAPVLEVLPVQRLALDLALARGTDPDRPRGLTKVTRTR